MVTWWEGRWPMGDGPGERLKDERSWKMTRRAEMTLWILGISGCFFFFWGVGKILSYSPVAQFFMWELTSGNGDLSGRFQQELAIYSPTVGI